jgi:hypothetical protein
MRNGFVDSGDMPGSLSINGQQPQAWHAWQCCDDFVINGAESGSDHPPSLLLPLPTDDDHCIANLYLPRNS